MNGAIAAVAAGRYSANWQLLEERVDANYISSPGLNKRVQYFWVHRSIDDYVMHRADLNDDGDYGDSNEGTRFHLTDAMFSTVVIVNRSGDIVERVSYDSYENAVPPSACDFAQCRRRRR